MNSQSDHNAGETREGGGGCILGIFLIIGIGACASLLTEDSESDSESIDGRYDGNMPSGGGGGSVSCNEREFLSGQSDGADWARVSFSTRMSFCRNLSTNFRREGLSNRPADWFYDAFNGFYGSPATDSTTLAEAAALFVSGD